MLFHILFMVVVIGSGGAGGQGDHLQGADYPEGYYPFEEAPAKIPPKVRKPPYLQSKVPCPGTLESKEQQEQSLDNLCGDLNDGLLPLNPLGQSILGHSYPFDLIKNKTLDFFSKTLPILKEDNTLPKVAKLRSKNVPLRDQFRVIRRPIRSAGEEEPASAPLNAAPEETGEEEMKALVEGRGARAFCDDNWGLFCLIYNTVSGKSSTEGVAQDRHDDPTSNLNSLGGGVQPLTPCPSAVEYITPVFARNYQGMWRYVVQIPYEGYFTQTVEVTQCLSPKCHYLAGACLASPRWVSLLVAEVYYPDALFPASPPRPDFRFDVLNALLYRITKFNTEQQCQQNVPHHHGSNPSTTARVPPTPPPRTPPHLTTATDMTRLVVSRFAFTTTGSSSPAPVSAGNKITLLSSRTGSKGGTTPTSTHT